MEIKLSRLIFCIFLILICFKIQAQDKFNMDDVYIDSIRMSDAHFNYGIALGCKLIKDSLYNEENIEKNIRSLLFSSSGIIIKCDADEKYRYLFTYYIEIKSSKYLVKLKEKEFKVGMQIDELGILLPEILKEYEDIIKKENKNYSRAMYIGLPLIIKNKGNVNMPYYNCQGLKFQIQARKVISILIDFRSDGDFD